MFAKQTFARNMALAELAATLVAAPGKLQATQVTAADLAGPVDAAALTSQVLAPALPQAPVELWRLDAALFHPPGNLEFIFPQGTSAPATQVNAQAKSPVTRLVEVAKESDQFINENFGPFGWVAKAAGILGVAGITALSARSLLRGLHPREVKIRELRLATQPEIKGPVLIHAHRLTDSTNSMLLPPSVDSGILKPFLAEMFSPRFWAFREAQAVSRFNPRYSILAFKNDPARSVLGKFASVLSEPESRAMVLDEAAVVHSQLSAVVKLLDNVELPPLRPTDNIPARIGVIFESRSIKGGKEHTDKVNHIEVASHCKIIHTFADLPMYFAGALNHEAPTQRELLLQDIDHLVEFGLQSLNSHGDDVLKLINRFPATEKRVLEVAALLQPMLLLPRAQSILYLTSISLGLCLYAEPSEVKGKTLGDLMQRAQSEVETAVAGGAKLTRGTRPWLLQRTLQVLEDFSAQCTVDLATLPALGIQPKGFERCVRREASTSTLQDPVPQIQAASEGHSTRSMRQQYAEDGLRGVVEGCRQIVERWKLAAPSTEVATYLKDWNAAPTFAERLLRFFNLDARMCPERGVTSGNLDALGNLDWHNNYLPARAQIMRDYTEARKELGLTS
jgi:hypothetical protein